MNESNAYGVQQRPVKQSFCSSLRRDTHWKCLILSFLIYGCLAAITWCRLTTVSKVMLTFHSFPFTQIKEVSPCDEGYVYIPTAFMVMLYLVYLVECWHCHTRAEIQYKVNAQEIYQWITMMQEALPMVWWKATCFHYVRRARQVTRYRNGDAYSTTQVYYERINSHTAGAMFVFTRCGVKDTSKKLVGLEQYPATKIKFSKCFTFANLLAEQEFEEQRAHFFGDYAGRDDYMETREGMDLMDLCFRDYMIAYSDANSMPWYLSSLAFWLASLMLLSWPLRVLIEYKTAFLQYRITKLFGSNYSDLPPYSSTRTIYGSVDMNPENNYIVPSYSEAVLMDCRNNPSIFELSTRIREIGSTPNIGIHTNTANLKQKGNNCINVLRTNDIRRLRRSRSRFSLLLRRSSFGSFPRSHTVTLAITPEESATGCCTGALDTPTSPPPNYDQALQMCVPMSQMKRSRTERDMISQRRSDTNRSVSEHMYRHAVVADTTRTESEEIHQLARDLTNQFSGPKFNRSTSDTTSLRLENIVHHDTSPSTSRSLTEGMSQKARNVVNQTNSHTNSCRITSNDVTQKARHSYLSHPNARRPNTEDATEGMEDTCKCNRPNGNTSRSLSEEPTVNVSQHVRETSL